MPYTAADYAEAIWSHEPRTLASGSAGSPSGYAEQVAQAMWSYAPRTLTVDPPGPDPGRLPTIDPAMTLIEVT